MGAAVLLLDQMQVEGPPKFGKIVNARVDQAGFSLPEHPPRGWTLLCCRVPFRAASCEPTGQALP